MKKKFPNTKNRKLQNLMKRNSKRKVELKYVRAAPKGKHR